MRELTVFDLLVFQVLCEAPGISLRKCHTVVNERIEHQKMPSDYTEKALDKSSVDVSIGKLREGGLIALGSREILGTAAELWRRVGSRWKQWPYGVPVANGQVDYLGIRKRTA